MAAFGVRRVNSMEQRDTFIECANDIDDLFLAIYEKDMGLLQRLLRIEDTRTSSSTESKWKRQGIFVKLEEDLDDAFDSDNFRKTLKESSLKRSLYVKRASIKKRFEISRMCHAQFRGLVEDRGYPLYPTAGEYSATLQQVKPPKKCLDVNKMDEHMDLVISYMDNQLKMFLTDTIHNLELVRDEINKVINEFYRRLETGELTLRENANKRQIYSKLESFEGDKISIELSLSFFRDCYMKIDADTMKLLGGRLISFEKDPSSAMEHIDTYEGVAEVGDEDERMNIESIVAEEPVQKPIPSNARPNKIKIHRSNGTDNDMVHVNAASSKWVNPHKDAVETNGGAAYDRSLYSFPQKASNHRQLERSDSGGVDVDSLRNIQRAINEARALKVSKPRNDRKRYSNANEFDWDWDKRRSPFGINSFGMGGYFD